MKCGIIGLPNVGKSTFFNIISKSNVRSENFPFSTIEPNHGLVYVPDNRLIKLQNIVNSIKITPSNIKITDIAGLIKGSHKGDGLGNKFLSHIRETDVLIHIIRSFDKTDIIHIEGSVDPIRDKEIIDIELQLKDLESIEKKLKKIPIQKKYEKLIQILNKLSNFIKKGENVRNFLFSESEIKHIKNLQLLTMKPIIYICNIQKNINEKIEYKIKNLELKIKMENSILIKIPFKDKNIFFKTEKVINEIKKIIKIQNFFTVGKKEIRSWNIPNPCTAYQASSVIHTDFKKGFIKAEIIHFNDYIKYKSYEKIKRLGKIFIYGKNSLIQDGDIINFKFSYKRKNFLF